jgi:hypothetical protein
VGEASVDLFYERRAGHTSVVIDGIRGKLDVDFNDEWPLRASPPITH